MSLLHLARRISYWISYNIMLLHVISTQELCNTLGMLRILAEKSPVMQFIMCWRITVIFQNIILVRFNSRSAKLSEFRILVVRFNSLTYLPMPSREISKARALIPVIVMEMVNWYLMNTLSPIVRTIPIIVDYRNSTELLCNEYAVVSCFGDTGWYYYR